MESIIYTVRRINPIFVLPIFWITLTIFMSLVYGNTHENMVQVFKIIVISFAVSVSILMILNRLTQGKKEIKSGYVSQVGVSIFGGSNLRWEGYFKTKFAAQFAALYRAWYLDHFGMVHYECGIVYGVRSYNKE